MVGYSEVCAIEVEAGEVAQGGIGTAVTEAGAPILLAGIDPDTSAGNCVELSSSLISSSSNNKEYDAIHSKLQSKPTNEQLNQVSTGVIVADQDISSAPG